MQKTVAQFLDNHRLTGHFSFGDLYQKYKEVKRKALYSIGLVGIGNITELIVGGVSPFNIADQVDLPPPEARVTLDLELLVFGVILSHFFE